MQGMQGGFPGLWSFGRNTSATQPLDSVAAPSSLSVSLTAATSQFHQLQQQHHQLQVQQLQNQQHQRQLQVQPTLPTIQISSEAAARASMLFGASQPGNSTSLHSVPSAGLGLGPGLDRARLGASPSLRVSVSPPPFASEKPARADGEAGDDRSAASRCDPISLLCAF
jgi:TolA-binding protein